MFNIFEFPMNEWICQKKYDILTLNRNKTLRYSAGRRSYIKLTEELECSWKYEVTFNI